MKRSTSLQQFAEGRRWDVLVIGGGATGLGAAVEAASRGYRTALVEQADFAQATSSRSTKLIHGGVRYLQQGNLALVREALREQSLLLQNAPSLVRPVPLALPLTSAWERFYYTCGLRLYDVLAGRRSLARTRHLSTGELQDRVPGFHGRAPSGGLLFYDGQFDDARLAIALAQTLADLGGAPLNYARVTGLLKRDGRIVGARVRDEAGESDFEAEARVVINATGVFSDTVRRLDEPAATATVRPSQGAHLVLPGRFLGGETGLLLPRTDDGRVLFALPWQGRVLLGTTDTPVADPVLDPVPQPREVEFLLAHAKRHLGWEIGPADVLSTYAGLRPLVSRGAGHRTSALPRDHVITVSPSGLVSIAGGKWTTYRRMGEDVVDRAGLDPRPSRTASLALHSPAPSTAPEEPLDAALPVTRGDILRAVREEMALTLEDILSRRTRALILDARAAARIAPDVAAIVAAELGHEAAWGEQQIAGFRALCSRSTV